MEKSGYPKTVVGLHDGRARIWIAVTGQRRSLLLAGLTQSMPWEFRILARRTYGVG
jgi:hypothetical protein